MRQTEGQQDNLDHHVEGSMSSWRGIDVLDGGCSF